VDFQPTALPEVILIQPDVHRDDRGFFFEVYHARKYAEGGVAASFVQDNQSRSVNGILRGLHGQRRHPQGKLVRVIEGEIFDVAVDVRRGSPHFGDWVGVTLSGENFHQLYVPPGFLHGFCVVSEVADVMYKCTDFYDGPDEIGVRWDDPDIGIEWPTDSPLVSAKDAAAPLLSEISDQLPSYGG